jgi:hypothetical protein
MLTPAGAVGLSAAGTDWLLFLGFCVNPMSPRQVTMPLLKFGGLEMRKDHVVLALSARP